MHEQLPITVVSRAPELPHAELRTASGHAFTLPHALVPDACGPGGCFSLDLNAVTEADMPDDLRHGMSRALLNELLATGTA